VLLVVIDTFGAEHGGAFLHPGRTHTPNLDRLAAEGVVFPNAHTTAPWTKPAIASLFTGLMPRDHGSRQLSESLPASNTTLPQEMAARGLRTAGIVSHVMLKRRFGFGRGFDFYDQSLTRGKNPELAISSARVTDKALGWLERNPERPFFLFLHYFDPHYAYMHHPDFDRTSDYTGPLQSGLDIWELRERRQELQPADVDYLIGLHHEEIAFTDQQIGLLLAHLEERGERERTLIIVVADHGEEFLRHGWIGHTVTLYEELLNVPMIISLPGSFPPRVVSAPVSVMDIYPTLMELAGAESTPAKTGGRSLLPLLQGQTDWPEPRPLFAEVSFSSPRRAKAQQRIAFLNSVLLGRHKLIHDLTNDTWMLFDLKDDPEELRNLAGRDGPTETHLRSLLSEFEEQGAKVNPTSGHELELPEEELQRLRSLGYIR